MKNIKRYSPILACRSSGGSRMPACYANFAWLYGRFDQIIMSFDLHKVIGYYLVKQQRWPFSCEIADSIKDGSPVYHPHLYLLSSSALSFHKNFFTLFDSLFRAAAASLFTPSGQCVLSAKIIERKRYVNTYWVLSILSSFRCFTLALRLQFGWALFVGGRCIHVEHPRALIRWEMNKGALLT